MLSNFLTGSAVLSLFSATLYVPSGSGFLGYFLFVLGLFCLVCSFISAYLEHKGFVVDSADMREGLAALFNDVLSFLGVKKWILLLRLHSSMAISKLASSTSARLSLALLR